VINIQKNVVTFQIVVEKVNAVSVFFAYGPGLFVPACWDAKARRGLCW
jgi:hypothetical protein